MARANSWRQVLSQEFVPSQMLWIDSRFFVSVLKTLFLSFLITVTHFWWTNQAAVGSYLFQDAMVIIFLFFGYSKWFRYEAQSLILLVSHEAS